MTYMGNDFEGWMSLDEMRWLHEMAKNCQTIVEIGSWCGKSTHALLTGCPGTVYAVDHFQGSPDEIHTVHARATTDDIYAEFIRNVGHFPNLRVLKMDSVEASKLFMDGAVDMVFVDGEHTRESVMRDLEAWMPKAKMICGHDYNCQGVSSAIRTLGFSHYLSIHTIWVRCQEPIISRDGDNVTVQLPCLSVFTDVDL